MDEIVIDNLRVFCNHGVYAEERSEGQNFFVTAKVFLETYIAGVTDDLNNTVNYAGLCQVISDFMWFIHEFYGKSGAGISESVIRQKNGTV